MYSIISVAQIWPPVSFSWKSRFSKNVLYKIHIDIRVWQKCNFFENFVLSFITSIKSKKINQHQISRRLVYHARHFENFYFFDFIEVVDFWGVWWGGSNDLQIA